MKKSEIQRMEKLVFARSSLNRVSGDIAEVELSRYRNSDGRIYQLDERNNQYKVQKEGATEFDDWQDCDPE